MSHEPRIRDDAVRTGSGRLPSLPLVAVVLLAACEPPPPPPWHAAEGHRWRELVVEGRGAGFTAMRPSRTGVDFENVLDLEGALANEHLLIGSGVALADVDGDGRTDLYFARLEGPNVLYRNLGGWRFEDVTEEAGVGAPGRASTGASFADADGDGDPDLFVTALGEGDVFFRNDGSGRFEDATEAAGLGSPLGSTTTTWADVDGDGDLDLYRAAYKVESATDVLPAFQRGTADVVRESGDSLVVAEEFRDHFRMEEQRGRMVAVEQAEPDRLYLNEGGGRFRPVPWDAGAFLDAEGRPLASEVDDFGLAARFHDVDGDGDPDLYVCNDFDDPDRLWLNQGDGTFREAPSLALRTTSHASMSVDFADVDRDGHTDFFVADMLSLDPARRLVQTPLHGPIHERPGVIDDRIQARRNTLFLGRGDGTWAQIAELADVDASEWSWTSLFLDVDLDGYEDLLIANGYSRDTQHGDVQASISRMRGRAPWRELKLLYPELPTRNVAFRNRGDLTFETVEEGWGIGEEPDISHGMAAGDLDGDGDLDLVVNRLNAPARLLRNDAGGPRVAVRLRGTPPNTDGVGARVTLLDGAVPEQRDEVTAGGLYLSSSEPLLTFAAARDREMTLEVAWPGGRTSVVEGVRADRLYEIEEPPAGDPERSPPAPGGTGAEDTGPEDTDPGDTAPEDTAATPLFEDVSSFLDHRHRETAFEDFMRQPLLPFQPSRLGPGVSWIDVDADGDPDLVVPPGRGGKLTFLRNDVGRFVEVELVAEEAALDRTAVVPIPGVAGAGPRSGPGAPLLLVGQSSWEAHTADAAREAAALLAVAPGSGGGALSAVGGGLSSTGPVAVADVDLDGDLDVFVGGRMIPGLYPVAATSRLLLGSSRPVSGSDRSVARSEGVALEVDRVNAELLEQIGLVSGAVFSDVDRDGDPDLLLALEWGPPRLLVNEGGRFADATEAWGLDALHGRWNGITTGDLDGDGLMDVVVSGWGRNLRDRPREGRPLVLFHGDLDRNGSWDPILAQSPGGGDGLRVLERYERIRGALPSLRRRLPTFEAYAGASLEEILGRDPGETPRLVATTYEHHLLLNRGGTFEARPLPVEAQFAPAFGVTVGDLDHDGREDVFLAQNFFPTPTTAPRLDAGLGLLLRGDGAGGLTPVPAARSGIRVWGDQRGAALADWDGDGRTDLAVAQNAGPTRLFRNVGERRGLVVELRGAPGNPNGVGAVVRVVYADRVGPAREIHAGSGYWSVDSPVVVMGLAGRPVAVRVRWPGGLESEIPVAGGAERVRVSHPGSPSG